MPTNKFIVRHCKIFRQFGFLLMALLVSGCAWLDTQQRAMIYRPTAGVPSDFVDFQAPDARYFLAVPNTTQRVEVWWLPHKNETAPALLYYHGTFRNLYENLEKINALRRAGFSILAVDYRGWGLSTPMTPSERTIMQDADVAWQEFVRKVPDSSRRVIYGHSMGSGVAVDVASRLHAKQNYAGLILESAFTSFPDVARAAAPRLGSLLSALNEERFDSLSKIKLIHAPLLMIHGSADDTIPQTLGEQLFAAAHTPKQWLSVVGATHSNAQAVDEASYQQALQKFQAVLKTSK